MQAMPGASRAGTLPPPQLLGIYGWELQKPSEIPFASPQLVTPLPTFF